MVQLRCRQRSGGAPKSYGTGAMNLRFGKLTCSGSRRFMIRYSSCNKDNRCLGIQKSSPTVHSADFGDSVDLNPRNCCQTLSSNTASCCKAPQASCMSKTIRGGPSQEPDVNGQVDH